ncbi:DUF4190 domain-containing protein [Cohnella herbarum]|uniref:DUF4190 domain-containing protein n=1 Tax=Cohnella herbarum TaxID=2728023 RepID=A0A7Z2ZNE1_9BACL|nr:DUF4190 domain-containing protein [Cohnella herbarum]QJD86108.1 DUF4190 domain-containing protein [Cohnella herbarum]
MDHNYKEPQYGFSPPPPFTPQKTNGKSIAALVLGILAIVLPYIGFIVGIIAIIFASLSLKEIKRTQEQGRGLAIAGLVCGIVGTAVYAVILLFVVIAFFAFFDAGFSSFNSYNF